MDSPFLTAQLFVTGALVGLCWTVQLAVYPLFSALVSGMSADAFRAYHAAYTRAMGWVAGPLMTVELVVASAWVLMRRDLTAAWFGLGLVIAIWVLTFVFIVPAHVRIQAIPQVSVAERLTRLNWIRTALWSARDVLLALVAFGP